MVSVTAQLQDSRVTEGYRELQGVTQGYQGVSYAAYPLWGTQLHPHQLHQIPATSVGVAGVERKALDEGL